MLNNERVGWSTAPAKRQGRTAVLQLETEGTVPLQLADASVILTKAVRSGSPVLTTGSPTWKNPNK